MFFNSKAQEKSEPLIFRWQDKYAKKQIHKYLEKDTILKTSQAQIHIHYTKKEGQRYLLMLHGMGANARTNWGSQIKTLSKDFNLIMPDLIYFGESSSASQNFSVEFQAQQINEAILKLNINEKINVMGFSYGGLATAMYNELFHDQVKKIIIIDGPVKFFSGSMADSMAQIVNVKNINNVIVPTTISEFNSMKKAVMSRGFPASRNLKRKLLKYFFLPTKAIRDMQMNYLLEYQTTYQAYNYNLDKTPTLLIWGEKDGVVPLSIGQNLHKAFPSTTQLLVFPKAKHDAHFREYKKVNKAVLDFLKH